MTLTADQYLQLANSYDEAARDPSIAPAQREVFAKEGRWFRYLAERERGILELKEPIGEGRTASTALRRARIGPALTTLWLTGAAIYLAGTLLMTNTVTDSFRSETRDKPDVSRPLSSPNASETTQEIAQVQSGVQLSKLPQEKPHAINPNEPPYEAAGLVPPVATEASQNLTSQVPIDQASTPLARDEPEVLRVTASATIRNRPSPDSKAIGTASPGAELRVNTRENGWVQFVDPSSGNSGWIESRLLGAASSTSENSVETTSSAETPVEQTKSKAVKKRMRKKPIEPTQIVKQRPNRPSASARTRAQANLPEDQAFINSSPRRGFFARRRMMREGLLSPDFNPPR